MKERGNKMKKKWTACFLCGAILTTTALTPMTALADRVDNQPYLALGNDLSGAEQAKVLELLNIKENELGNYNVTKVTNQQEHEYLGAYLDAGVIGTRALSSVKVEGKEDGYGIKVKTHNISYCTEGMYQNALATAGIEDADVVVAGPMSISGTAALVGAMEAYAVMNGEVIEPELADGATNELVVTSQVADKIGDSKKAEELIAAVKEIVVANEYNSEEDINKAIDDVAAQLEVNLSEEDRQLIRDLMQKLSNLDIDLDSLKEQAGELYDRIANLDLSKYGISQEAVDGFFAKLGQFFSNLFDQIKSWFN